MKKLLRIAAVVATGVSLSTGVVAAQSGSIGTTGPDSTNKIEFRNRNRLSVENRNHIRATNNNPQSASTGYAGVKHNTTGGSATSGNASNDSMLSATVNLDNSGALAGASDCGCAGNDSEATIENTGPDSYNKVLFQNSSTTTVKNNNNISVTNNNSQSASTGDASVRGNTTGGDATSGDASNVSTTDLSFTVTN